MELQRMCKKTYAEQFNHLKWRKGVAGTCCDSRGIRPACGDTVDDCGSVIKEQATEDEGILLGFCSVEKALGPPH